jgi:hypothetical protein
VPCAGTEPDARDETGSDQAHEPSADNRRDQRRVGDRDPARRRCRAAVLRARGRHQSDRPGRRLPQQSRPLTLTYDRDLYILVLEDLKAFAAGDQLAGLTRAQALACANAIAPLHGAWWKGDAHGALPWAPTVERQLGDLAITPARFREAWPPFLDEYGDSLSAAGRALGERVNQ